MLSVVISTHNPNRSRLQRTLAGLRVQSLPVDQWETIIIDNRSDPEVTTSEITTDAPRNLRIVKESRLGLSIARRRGLLESKGDLIILVDDDNVLARDYLETATRLLQTHTQLGAAGGRSVPEFESKPENWVAEFHDLLACRDLGAEVIIAHRKIAAPGRLAYPTCAPIGAGMILRRESAMAWLNSSETNAISDRLGTALSSGGDNDIILTVFAAGWAVGYFPSLSLIHLIPETRTSKQYLGRLNRGIAESWVKVLAKHGACPWLPIPVWIVPLRQFRSYFRHFSLSSPAAWVRWQGTCGHFAGLAAIGRNLN